MPTYLVDFAAYVPPEADRLSKDRALSGFDAWTRCGVKVSDPSYSRVHCQILSHFAAARGRAALAQRRHPGARVFFTPDPCAGARPFPALRDCVALRVLRPYTVAL
jgi:hypothetical protein